MVRIGYPKEPFNRFKLASELATLHRTVLTDSILSKVDNLLLALFYLLLILDKHNVVLVLKLNTKIIGFLLATIKNYSLKLMLTKQRIRPEIQFFAIYPELQGKGFGTKLVKKFNKECKLRGVKEYLVNTKADNILSNKFYLKSGFKYLETKRILSQSFNYYIYTISS